MKYSQGVVTFASLHVRENDDNIVVKSYLPGVSQHDINVTIDNGLLEIQIDMDGDSDLEGTTCLVGECHLGSIHRSVQLPDTVDMESQRADYENGVLAIIFDKLETAKPKRIEVKVPA